MSLNRDSTISRKRKGWIIPAAAALLLAVVSYVFFQFFYPYHGYLKEQLILFLFTPDYLATYFAKPAWLACMAGDFFTQCYSLYGGAATVLTLTLLAVWYCFTRVFRTWGLGLGPASVLALIPAVLEGLLQCGLHASLSAPLSVILGCAAYLLYEALLFPKRTSRKEAPKQGASASALPLALSSALLLELSSALLLALLVFHTAGSGLMVFLLAVGVRTLLGRSKRTLLDLSKRPLPGRGRRLWQIALIGTVLVGLALALPLATRSAYGLTQKQAFLYPRKEQVTWRPDFVWEQLLALDAESYWGHPQRVLQLADKYAMKHTLATYYTNLALAQLGQLPQRLLSYYQPATQGLFLPVTPASTPLTILFSGQVFYRLGDLNRAQHSAMLGMTFSPNQRSSRQVRTLADILIALGDAPAAEKYLRLLDHTWLHRGWAAQRRALLYGARADGAQANGAQPNGAQADGAQATEAPQASGAQPDGAQAAETPLSEEAAALEHLRALLPHQDVLRLGDDPVPSLEWLLEGHPTNRAALDYLLCYHLLNKDIPAFKAAYDRWMKGFGAVPCRLYAEGLLVALIQEEASQTTIDTYNIPPLVMQDFMDYTRQYQAAQGQMKPLQAQYGQGYWFYYHFATMVKL